MPVPPVATTTAWLMKYETLAGSTSRPAIARDFSASGRSISSLKPYSTITRQQL